MVSLSDNSRHSGGYFFNDEQQSIQISDSDDHELLRDHVTLTEEHEIPFRKINTLWAIIVQILISVALAIAAFVIPVLCQNTKCGVEDIALVVYVHGGLWFVLLVFDRFYRQQHNTSRLNGYLEFYRRTKNVRRIPFLIASGANAVLLIVMQVLDRLCKDPAHECSFLKEKNYIQIVITVETVITLPFLVIYLVRTLQFNKSRAHPDVSQDEMLSSFLQSQSQTSDIGFRDENYVDQVLEKQADMIRYLKQHNSQLGKRILILTNENNMLNNRK